MITMRALIVSALVLFSILSFASEFDGAPEEFAGLPKYTEAEIQKKIQQEMAVACQGNLCRIVGVDESGQSWTVSLNLGHGSQGSTTTPGGVVVVGNTSDCCDVGAYASLTITYKRFTCQSNLKVTPAVYRFVNTYLYNMVNADGSVKRNFSPADQTVVLFYTTLLNKVSTCKGS